ncbi:hypothetical protein ILYODFUR_021449 [Ilyodon furcidens]|uniref:Uncharacterized protein n=1 Tax=Ilyodon furcidens TaxID=33524 RepID=A0ABV0VIJ6_9TELE
MHPTLFPHLRVMSNAVFLSLNPGNIAVSLLLHTYFNLIGSAEKLGILLRQQGSGVLEQGVIYNKQDSSRSSCLRMELCSFYCDIHYKLLQHRKLLRFQNKSLYVEHLKLGLVA